MGKSEFRLETNWIIDESKMYRGDDYRINESIHIHQPKVGEIIDMGEKEYYGMLSSFTAIPSDLKAQLWERQLNWMEVSDFDLFCMLVRSVTPEQSSILFGPDLDFTKFDPYLNSQNNMIVLRNDDGIVIDVNLYNGIAQYLRKIHGIVPKVEKAANKATWKVLIREAQMNLASNSRKPYKSMMQPMLSSMVNSPGFKYNLKQTMEIGIVEFMDSVKRIQTINYARDLTLGMYMGNIDSSKIDKSQLTWLRKLD